jgi:hypothetical protein
VILFNRQDTLRTINTFLSFRSKEVIMNPKQKIFILSLVILGGLMFLAAPCFAVAPIAKISSFKGDIIVQSQNNILPITQAGQTLMEGDRIQTKEGEVEITFNDGAVMKVRPFTTTLIQEREEESGWWIFKTKKAVRRITVLVGKFWFKSGASKSKNYLQTPTAVCGLRGSIAEAGNDNVNNLLNILEGTGEKLGLWTEGAFGDPGSGAATANPQYTALAAAQEKVQAATTPEEKAAAQKEVLAAAKAAAQEIAQGNPDPAAQAAAAQLIEAADKLLEVIDQTGEPLPPVEPVPEPVPEPEPEPVPTITMPPTTEPPTTFPTTTTTTTTTTTEATPTSS